MYKPDVRVQSGRSLECKNTFMVTCISLKTQRCAGSHEFSKHTGKGKWLAVKMGNDLLYPLTGYGKWSLASVQAVIMIALCASTKAPPDASLNTGLVLLGCAMYTSSETPTYNMAHLCAATRRCWIVCRYWKACSSCCAADACCSELFSMLF